MIRIKISDIVNAAKTKPDGYLDDVYSMADSSNGSFLSMTLESYERLLEKYSGKRVVSLPSESAQQADSHGPGTELKKLLARVGITASPDCSCNARARTMDERGIEWCEANIDEIVGWLREEAQKRGLPFVDMAGKMLVKRAIKNAGKATLE